MSLKREQNPPILLDLTSLIFKEVSDLIYILATLKLQIPDCIGEELGQIIKMGGGHNVEFDIKMQVFKHL